MLAAGRVPSCPFCRAVTRDGADVDAEFDKADRISRIHQAYRRKRRRW